MLLFCKFCEIHPQEDPHFLTHEENKGYISAFVKSGLCEFYFWLICVRGLPASWVCG